MNNDIQVNIPSKESNYSIYINDAPIKELKNKIFEITSDRNYLVVISKKVHNLYGKKLCFDKARTLIIPDGEKEKNFNNYCKILKKLELLLDFLCIINNAYFMNKIWYIKSKRLGNKKHWNLLRFVV